MPYQGILGVIPTAQSATLLGVSARRLKQKKRIKTKDLLKDFTAISVGVPMIKSTSDIIKTV